MTRLFSRMHFDKRESLDCELARRRLATYIDTEFVINELLSNKVGAELGLKNSIWSSSGLYKFFDEAEIKYVLSAVTLVYDILRKSEYDRSKAKPFLEFAQRVFEEECLGYEVKPDGSVTYKVDEDFEGLKESTLIHLEKRKYGSVKNAYEGAIKNLISTDGSYKAAITDMFFALETLVKIIFLDTKIERLSDPATKSSLEKLVSEKYKDNASALISSKLLVESFWKWVNSLHVYRHGQREEEVVEPPKDITNFIVSSGSSYLRWILELTE